MIHGLQVFRGCAAFSVVLHHSVLSTNAFVGTLPLQLSTLLNLGFLGVDFFFVLSGFIIMHSHLSDKPTRTAATAYAFKRITRVFPAYWPVGLAMALAYSLLPGVSAAPERNFGWLTSLLLIPTDSPPALSVAWTLIHELQFYAIFMLYFISSRLFFLGLMLWAIVIIGVQLLIDSYDGVARYALSILNLEFVLGVLAAWFFARYKNFQGAAFFIYAGIAISVAALCIILLSDAGHPYRLIFAFGVMLVILGIAFTESQRRIAWPDCLLALGSASYSIYLIHNPVLSFTQRLAGAAQMHWFVGLLFGVCCAIIAGLAYWTLIERPVLLFIRRANKKG
jgi:exopolysaccharide production protein ExoZ